MADTGWVYPTAEGNVYSEWLDPEQAYQDNDVGATCYDYAGYVRQDYYNYDFSAIPDAAEIDGVEVRYKCKMKNASTEMQLAVQLIILSHGFPTPSGDTNTESWDTTTWTDKDLGGATDDWGVRLTTAIVKDTSNFGVWAAGSLITGAGGNDPIRVDYALIKIYWHLENDTEASVGMTISKAASISVPSLSSVEVASLSVASIARITSATIGALASVVRSISALVSASIGVFPLRRSSLFRPTPPSQEADSEKGIASSANTDKTMPAGDGTEKEIVP